MSNSKGSADEAIGRPGPWQEGRFQQPDKPVDVSVTTPAGETQKPPGGADVPVTLQDYEL